MLYVYGLRSVILLLLFCLGSDIERTPISKTTYSRTRPEAETKREHMHTPTQILDHTSKHFAVSEREGSTSTHTFVIAAVCSIVIRSGLDSGITRAAFLLQELRDLH